jgi:hypothetical protein
MYGSSSGAERIQSIWAITSVSWCWDRWASGASLRSVPKSRLVSIASTRSFGRGRAGRRSGSCRWSCPRRPGGTTAARLVRVTRAARAGVPRKGGCWSPVTPSDGPPRRHGSGKPAPPRGAVTKMTARVVRLAGRSLGSRIGIEGFALLIAPVARPQLAQPAADRAIRAGAPPSRGRSMAISLRELGMPCGIAAGVAERSSKEIREAVSDRGGAVRSRGEAAHNGRRQR